MANITQYSNEQRYEAAIMWATTGVMSQVARALDIPETTLSSWKREWPEWDDVIADVRTEKALEHRQAYSRLVDKSLRAAERGIDKLDGQKLTANDIKALVITGAASTDKIRLADNQPTRITATDSSTQSVLAFLETIGKKYRDAKEVVVIEQVIDETEEPS